MAIPANIQNALLDQEARGTIEPRDLEIILELRSRGQFPAASLTVEPTVPLDPAGLSVAALEAELLA